MSNIKVSTTGNKCYACVSEYLVAKKAYDSLVDKTGVEEPTEASIKDADTWGPSWQEHMAYNQVMMAVCALPVCLGHLGVTEDTPLQRAAKAGLALPGQN